MTIEVTDLLFFRSEYMNDSDSGGGNITGQVAQDNVSNNVFPSLTPGERSAGALHARRIFAAVMNDDGDDVFSGARLSISQVPVDDKIDGLLVDTRAPDRKTLFPGGGIAQPEITSVPVFGGAVETGANAFQSIAFPFSYVRMNAANGDTAGNIKVATEFTDAVIEPGDLITFTAPTTDQLAGSRGMVGRVVLSATPVAGTINSVGGVYEVQFADGPAVAVPGSVYWFRARPGQNLYGSSPLAANVTTGATSITVEDPFFRRDFSGVSTNLLAPLGGRVLKFWDGQTIALRNGGTVEILTIKRVHPGGKIYLTTPVAGTFPAGSVVSALMPAGDIGAKVSLMPFAQQTWTRQWSDLVIGASIASRYNQSTYPIAVVNAGAETERWAIVFTSSVEFELYGERFGKIATGTIGDDFSPLSPRTNYPLFTLAADGWGAGWLRGNCLRFNTQGAHRSAWLLRSTSPGATDATGNMKIAFRGGA